MVFMPSPQLGNIRPEERFREERGGLGKITKPLLIITIFRRSNFGIDESIIKVFTFILFNYCNSLCICLKVSLPSKLKLNFDFFGFFPVDRQHTTVQRII